MNTETHDQIQNLIDELTECLKGEVKYYICSDLHTKHKKIEIIYDRQKK